MLVKFSARGPLSRALTATAILLTLVGASAFQAPPLDPRADRQATVLPTPRAPSAPATAGVANTATPTRTLTASATPTPAGGPAFPAADGGQATPAASQTALTVPPVFGEDTAATPIVLSPYLGAAPRTVSPIPTPRPRPSPTPGGRRESDERGPRYAGWAMEAYPWLSADTMEQAVRAQVSRGANVVWIGHNNPGEVEPNAAEPGISYAVYEALQDPNDPRYADARAVFEAQERMLRVIAAQGVKAVFPVGYQSQMGARWDAAHPDALRTESRGGINYTTTVVNASFYSPAYRQDIRRYYEWLDAWLVRPYRDTILMLNLADEPAGGDYSSWADAEFTARYGYGFADVGDDPARMAQLGAFQSGYIVDYAAWTAGQWAELEPDLPTTMSFEGATARIHLQLPNVEGLFARTPSSFYPTFDAYPRDGPPDLPLEDTELIRLFTLVRSLGHYSARYGKPFWLWSTANSWGLAQASPQPANVADAVANGYYLALLARQTGGWLQGIAVWNYNIVGQGLYNDTHRTTYEPDTMFARVSESLPRLRQIMAAPAGAARVLVLAPNTLAYRLLGASRSVDPFAFRSYDLHRLAVFARNNVPAAVVGELAGEDLSRVAAIVVLARFQSDLADDEVARLRGYLDRGGTVIALRPFDSTLGPRAQYVDGDRAEEAFADSPSSERTALWRRAFGVERPLTGGYAVATPEDALLYNIGNLIQAELRLPFAGRGWLADPRGFLLRRLAADGGSIVVALDKNHYAYLTR